MPDNTPLMNSAAVNPLFRYLSPIALATTLLVGAALAYQNFQLSELPLRSVESRLPAWSAREQPELSFDGHTFKKRTAELAAANLGPLAKRFRLAGTFFAASSSQQSRKAILDDLLKKTQCLVAEGDLLEQGILVVSIARDRIVLREGNPDLAESRDEQLWLSFGGGEKPGAPASRADTAAIQGRAEATLLRFGNRTGERRWVLQRGNVLRYYQELLNNPDRLARVFESLKPVYHSGKIAGYALDIEGEGDVFGAFGLKQGDIIRQVNSLPMISQSRAEYFINEFVKDRANAFVLDIERDARTEKFVYLLR
ncbi:MAG: hypothetical protein HYV36_03365 [Lentisphaerae bacterium]|nr:hypothetical protein [Lentisphaerota bacterium]